MPEFDEEMKGVLFPEFDRESDKHPTDKGHCTIEGKKYWVSAWKNTSKNGKAYRALRFEPAIEKGEGRNSQAWQNAKAKFKKDDVVEVDENKDINLDDIPF